MAPFSQRLGPPRNPGRFRRYSEYYSGYWNAPGRYCVTNGFAQIGVNGTVIELRSGTPLVEPQFGEIDSEGNVTFAMRETSSYCDDCLDHKYLKTYGHLDWDTGMGELTLQFACKANKADLYFFNSTTIQLSPGLTQPEPYAETVRIEQQILETAGEEPPCSETSDCRFLRYRLDDNDYCNGTSAVYSVLNADEEKLFELRDQYQHFAYLTGLYNGSFTIYCAPRQLMCEAQLCEAH